MWAQICFAVKDKRFIQTELFLSLGYQTGAVFQCFQNMSCCHHPLHMFSLSAVALYESWFYLIFLTQLAGRGKAHFHGCSWASSCRFWRHFAAAGASYPTPSFLLSRGFIPNVLNCRGGGVNYRVRGNKTKRELEVAVTAKACGKFHV